MELKDKLKELRSKNNMTQKELAEKIYVSRSAVAKWENGLGIPSEASIDELTKLFNISSNELLGNDIKEKVDKNKTIHIQRNLLLTLGAVLLTSIIIFVISFTIIKNKNDNKLKYIKFQSPEIALSNNTDYLTKDVYLYYLKDHTFQTTENYTQKDQINNIDLELADDIIYSGCLEDIKVHNKENEYELNYFFDNNTIDYIYVEYALLLKDEEYNHYSPVSNNISINRDTNLNLVKQAKINPIKIDWYRPNNYFKKVEINNNKFTIEDNEYINLIRIIIKINDIRYNYYFLYQ